MEQNNHKTIATFIHLSTFSRFIIPFGNFLGPIILWAANKDKSEFIDTHGKQAINFQISILLYAIIIGMVSIPFFAFSLLENLHFLDVNLFSNIQFNITKPSPLLYIGDSLGILAFIGFLLELLFIITASLKARDGSIYHYPLTITFLK